MVGGMASNEQASAYRKHRSAEDKQGNLAWGARVGGRALRTSPAAAAKDIETLFELSDDEKILWRLLRLARRYSDLEQCGLLPIDDLRAVLRGLVAADVVDMVEAEEAKALVPAEVRRLRAELEGKDWRPRGGLQARVFRPDISAPVPVAPAPAPPQEAPVPEPSAAPTKQKPGKLTLNAVDKKLKDQLAAVASSLSTVSHYQFLCVPESANDSAIRNAYVTLAREYHPDRLSGTPLADDPETLGFVDALFKRLGDAYKTLGNQETRSRYDRELAALAKASGPATPESRARRPNEARQAYTMAESYFKKKDYKTAEMHYRQASLFDPEEPLILVALAWCIYLNPDHAEEHRTADARRRLEEVLKKFKTAEAAYRLGRVLKDSGDEAAATKRFEEALSYNPQHTDAQREMRIAANRNKAEEGKKGLLDKLLKKR